MERPFPRRLRGLETVEWAGIPVLVASTALSRSLGLALLDRDQAGAGLLIPRCRSVHTFAMRFELDLFFVDSEGITVRVVLAVPPRRVLFERRADRVLEMPSA